MARNSKVIAEHAAWLEAAESQPPAKIAMPLPSLLGEALDLAAHFDALWKPPESSAPGAWFVQIESDKIYASLGKEIRELSHVIAAVQASRAIRIPTQSRAPVERATRLLTEMRSTLMFVFDDEQSRGRTQLDRLNREFGSAQSHDELALALETFAALLDEHRSEIERLSTFDFADCAHARATASALRQHSADKLAGPGTQRKDTTKLRNQLLTLLLLRMQNIRRAARYLFRDEPDRSKLFESVHERVRRRVRKR